MRHPILALSLLAAAGCAPEGGNKNSKSQRATQTRNLGTMTFVSDELLPPCNDDNQGALVYVQSTESFRTCGDGVWRVIELKGDKGDKGDAGVNGDRGEKGESANAQMERAIALYKQYRRSIVRVTLHCTRVSTVGNCANYSANPAFLGSGFVCGDSAVCTNAHVAICDPDCLELDRLEIQAIGTADTVNPDGAEPSAPFFSTSDTTPTGPISLHATRDLAKIAVSGLPSGIKPIPLATETYDKTVKALRPMLSMSFPLGFQDLYTDVGHVNTPNLKECLPNGSDSVGSKYSPDCPGAFYDFSTTNDTDHGSSGSPLIDLETGKVAGVTSAGTEGENANYTWAIDASLLSDIE